MRDRQREMKDRDPKTEQDERELRADRRKESYVQIQSMKTSWSPAASILAVVPTRPTNNSDPCSMMSLYLSRKLPLWPLATLEGSVPMTL